MHINDLKTDLKDGVALLNLLEIISGKPIGKRWNKNPRVPNQKYENNQIAIEFVQAEGLKLVNIGNSPSPPWIDRSTDCTPWPRYLLATYFFLSFFFVAARWRCLLRTTQQQAEWTSRTATSGSPLASFGPSF
jgi:hypothetical protein